MLAELSAGRLDTRLAYWLVSGSEKELAFASDYSLGTRWVYLLVDLWGMVSDQMSAFLWGRG